MRGRRWRRLAAVGLVAAAPALLTACSDAGAAQAAGAASPGSGIGYVAGDGSTVILPEAERKPAPTLAGTTLDGGTWSSADQLGHVVVANVWASWCAPCRAEAPTLQQTYTARAAEGVRFVGIDTRDTDAAAKAFVTRYGITYPNLVDPSGQLQLNFRDTLPPQAIPSTVFLDKQGRVAARILGEVDRTRLNGVIDELQAEPGPATGSAS
ncbi:MAG: TlpA family protein disulfide reductase [Candidatus Nanopelagicales bacterium]